MPKTTLAGLDLDLDVPEREASRKRPKTERGRSVASDADAEAEVGVRSAVVGSSLTVCKPLGDMAPADVGVFWAEAGGGRELLSFICESFFLATLTGEAAKAGAMTRGEDAAGEEEEA